MSNFENIEASIPIVKVESSPSASTLVDRMFGDDSDTSSEESVRTNVENFPSQMMESSLCQVFRL